MYCTDVSELCAAIKNIEKKDLKRILKRFKYNSYTFKKTDRQPTTDIMALHGPERKTVEAVVVDENEMIVIYFNDGSSCLNSAALPGSLSRITNSIIQEESR